MIRICSSVITIWAVLYDTKSIARYVWAFSIYSYAPAKDKIILEVKIIGALPMKYNYNYVRELRNPYNN